MVILNESKIKYEKLDELLEKQLLDIRFSQQVNIIVDVKEIIKKFFRPDILPDSGNQARLVEEISSDMINIIGHYRNYFYKKQKYTNFIFLYSYSECEEIKKILPEYKQEYYQKYFYSKENERKINITSRAIKVLEKVVNTIPNSVFIETSDVDELLYARYIIESSQSNIMNIILSNDEVFYQLLNQHTFILNLKGIKSNLLISETVVNTMTKKTDCTLTANSIPLIIALSGNKKYSIQGINSIATIKAVNTIEKLIEEEKAKDLPSIEVPIEFSKLDVTNKLEKAIADKKDLIIKNYQLVRNDELYYSKKLQIENTLSRTHAKGNIRYFSELNAKTFTTSPLQLDMILRGERVSNL